MEIAGRSRPRPGEFENGDGWCVVDGPGGKMIAVIDGLGHGPEAARASRTAVQFLKERQDPPDLAALMLDLSRAIAQTRGAAAALIHIAPDGRMRHAGVGNVEVLSRTGSPVRPVNAPGVVGSRIRRVMESEHRLAAGDRLVIFTDGISSRMDFDLFKSRTAEETAEAILGLYAKEHDDATCVVVIF